MRDSVPDPPSPSTSAAANTSHPDGACPCGAEVWRARFGSEWKLVEAGRGHVTLTFPLIPGEPIVGELVQRVTRLRLHLHRAFSASTVGRKKVRS